MQTGSLSTEETLLVLFFLFIYLVWYWRVEGDKCSSSLQLLLRQFTVPEEEKDSTMQKIATEHLPVARHLITAVLGTFLVITVAVDSTGGIQRPNRLHLYLDYLFYASCFACTFSASRSYISAQALYNLSLVSACFGMVHTALSESFSILFAFPIKVMQTLSTAAMLPDSSFALVGCISGSLDLLRLYQFDLQRGLLSCLVMTQLGSSLVMLVTMALLREHLMREPDLKIQEVNQFFHEHSAARRMLSVLCDAQVYLDQDLTIISHCRGLAQLFMSTSSSKVLEGRVFQDFLAVRDQRRFQSFVENAVKVFLAEEGGGDEHFAPSLMSGWKHRASTPTSLQVHVLDSHGLLVAVELFHICVPGPNGQRGHFIGISEAENAMSSQASQSDSGSGHSRSTHIAGNANMICSQNALQEIFAFKPLAAQSESSRGLDPTVEEGSDAMSVASGSSESSVTSASGLVGKMRACPEIEYGEIVVDAFCDRLAIREAFFRFSKPKSLDDPPAPSLLEWVWPSTRDKFHASISHGVNLLFAPPSVDVGRLQRKFDPIMFQLPFRMKNPCALVAHNVELVFAEKYKDKNEGGKSPSHASGEDVNVAEDDMLVKLQLSGFMVKKMTPSKPRMIKDLEERAKARADMVKSNSFVPGSDTPRRERQARENEMYPTHRPNSISMKGSKPPSLSDRSDTLEPIQEVRNPRRRGK